MENYINTLKLIDTASAHLKVQGIESGIVPMPGTDKSIVIGSPAEVVELMPELRGAIPTAWRNFARAIANLPHGAEANIAGMQSKAAQLLAAEGARGKVLPKDEGAVASVGRQLDFRPSEQYSAWFTVNRSKLRNHSIFTKGAVIWNAARAAHPVAASAGIEGLEPFDYVDMADGSIKAVYSAEQIERLLATQSAKQGTQPTDLSHRLRETADQQPGWKPLLMAAVEEIERYYDGMLAWKQTAEKKDRDWNAERMARVNERCAERAAAPLQTMDDTTRNEALEEAAKLFDANPHAEEFRCNIADAIRALMKSASPVSGEAGEKGGSHA